MGGSDKAFGNTEIILPLFTVSPGRTGKKAVTILNFV
jgi:hypothetical protein